MNRNLGGNLNLSTQRITYWELERNFPKEQTVLGLHPTSFLLSVMQQLLLIEGCWTDPTAWHWLFGDSDAPSAAVWGRHTLLKSNGGPGCPKVPAVPVMPGFFPWKLIHPAGKQLILLPTLGQGVECQALPLLSHL